MDDADRAQAEIERALESALARRGHPKLRPAGRLHCIECGGIIPDARRKALAGVLRCVECEELQERRRGAFAG